jgi:hypothetical protein
VTQNASTIACFVGFLIVAIVVLQFAGPYLYQYRLGDQRLEVKLFGLVPILVLYFSDISEAKVLSGSQLFNPWGGVRFANRVFAVRPVQIRRKKGLLRSVILTPDDPESLVAEINRRKDGSASRS